MTDIRLALAGLLSSKEDGEEVRFISKVFLISIHIHELVDKAKLKHSLIDADKQTKKINKLIKDVKIEQKEK